MPYYNNSLKKFCLYMKHCHCMYNTLRVTETGPSRIFCVHLLWSEIWMKVEQGPIALAVGARCLYIFYSPPSPSLWETTRYRLNYRLKRPLNQNQPTNHLLCFLAFRRANSFLKSRPILGKNALSKVGWLFWV